MLFRFNPIGVGLMFGLYTFGMWLGFVFINGAPAVALGIALVPTASAAYWRMSRMRLLNTPRELINVGFLLTRAKPWGEIDDILPESGLNYGYASGRGRPLVLTCAPRAWRPAWKRLRREIIRTRDERVGRGPVSS